MGSRRSPFTGHHFSDMETKMMRIAYESDLFMPPAIKIFSMLTDKAQVCIKDIHYDEAKGTVDIHMHRKEILEYKKTFFGGMKPIYSQVMIKSLLSIRQVEEMILKIDDRLVSDCNSCFIILFGMTVNDKQVYLGSAQEIRGQVLCEIFIKVKQVNIEFISDPVLPCSL